MSVMNPDERYVQLQEQWKANRDAYRGQRAIHKGGEKYLPPIGNMNLRTKKGREAYDAFKKRTLFFNATGSTVDGLTGLIFRKDPVNELPEQLSYIKNSVDLTNTTLKEFEEMVAREVMITDLVGIHTTMPETPEGISVAQAERMNIRPYLTMYKAEDILKIFYKNINNIQVLEMIVLREFVQISMGSEFERETFEQYRVLDMYQPKDEDGNPIGSMIYRERLFDDSGSLVSEVFPMIAGNNFDYIPFELVSINGQTKSVIEDLVHANINHYQMNASYTWGVYQTGFPTPTATGISEDELPSGIGPGEFWSSENEGAKFDILEAKAGGADKGKAYLDKVESYMAALGAELLNPAKMSAETAESKRLDKQAQYSTLSTIAQLVSASMQRALMIAAQWVGGNPEDVKVELNRDYYPTTMNAQMISALLNALQSGAISYETFWQNMQKGEVAPATRSAEDEKDLIDNQDPSGLSLGG